MDKPKMILAAGTGYLGKVLTRKFNDDYGIVSLTRSQSHKKNDVRYIHWDAETIEDWADELDGADVLINLTGKSVDCRYTDENKKLILESRTKSTKVLGEALKKCQNPPKIWINSASATIYRHSLDTAFTEKSTEFGSGFSVDVCKAWEEAFFDFDLPDTRQVATRITIVLGKTGGAIKPLLTMAKLFAGGRQGSGNQMFSWIHEDDYANAIGKIIQTKEIKGPVNIAAPNPLPNKDLMKAIRKAVNRPFGIPTPSWMMEIGARIIQTETELVLKSRYVLPGKLEKHNFKFQYPTIEKALDEIVD